MNNFTSIKEDTVCQLKIDAEVCEPMIPTRITKKLATFYSARKEKRGCLAVPISHNSSDFKIGGFSLSAAYLAPNNYNLF